MYEIDFTVTKASDEVEGHEGKEVALTNGWLARATFGTATLDIDFGTSFSVHSMSFTAIGCSRVLVVLKSRKGDRDNWVGGSAALRGGGVLQGGALVYDGILTAEESKKYLAARHSGEGLKALASQEEWVGMRISVSPSAGHEEFGLKKLTIDRQPTKAEAEARRSALALAAEKAAAAKSAAQPAPPAARPVQAPHTYSSTIGEGRVSVSRPSAPPSAPPTGSGSSAHKKWPCACNKKDCFGCGGSGQMRCKAHSLLCCLKISKAPSSAGRYAVLSELCLRNAHNTPPGGSFSVYTPPDYAWRCQYCTGHSGSAHSSDHRVASRSAAFSAGLMRPSEKWVVI